MGCAKSKDAVEASKVPSSSSQGGTLQPFDSEKHTCIEKDTFVELKGLRDDFFNGLTGIVVEGNQESGRLQVKLSLPPCRTISVQPENLCQAPPDSAACLMAKASKKGAAEELESAAAAALKREFRMTDEQRKAASAAQAVADSAAAFCASWPLEKFETFGFPESDISREEQLAYGWFSEYEDRISWHWPSYSIKGKSIEQLLANSDLIDAQYLIALAEEGGVMPRWQDLPEAAKINKHNVWRLRFWNSTGELPVLVWSYCWYSKEHPDPKGEQLQKALPILQIMVDYAKSFHEHCTIAVLQDYGSYPQWPRSPEERGRFGRGLKGELNQWYLHPSSIVLMMDVPPSEVPEHTNLRPYDGRGWCFTEKHLATIVKYAYAFWKLSSFEEKQILSMARSKLSSDKEKLPMVACKYGALREQMVAQRPVPLSPLQFAATMRQDVEDGSLTFTAKADIEFVIDMYKRGFVQSFENCASGHWEKEIFYWNLGWGDDVVPALTSAINYVKMNCNLTSEIALFLDNNNFSEDSKEVLEALQGMHLDILTR